MYMLPISREEVQDRVEAHLDLRYKDRRGEKVSRLVLEALADELRIYRLRCEEERESRRADMPRRGRSGRRIQVDRNRSRSMSRERRDRGRSPGNREQNHHGIRLPLRPPTPATAPRSANPGDPALAMSGALPYGTTVAPSTDITEPGIEKRRRSSRPTGAVPKYKPKIGLTMGWGTHLMNCVGYVAEEKAREKRSNERKERRQKRDEGREGLEKDLECYDKGLWQSGRDGGGRAADRPNEMSLRPGTGTKRVPAVDSTQNAEPNAWSYPPAPHRPASATDHTYHQTPHS